MFKNIGVPELLLIALVLVILFGSSKLSELARGAGAASRELKKAKSELEDTVKEISSEKPEGGVSK
jgi:sec-independent protein translocase protein TatA